MAEYCNVFRKGKEPGRLSDCDKVDSDEDDVELEEDKSDSEFESDSEALVDCAETSDLPVDSLGSSSKGEKSGSSGIKEAQNIIQEDITHLASSELHSKDNFEARNFQ